MNSLIAARIARATSIAGLLFAVLVSAVLGATLIFATGAGATVTIDKSFGANGTIYSPALTTIEGSALDPDGRIVVAGSAINIGSSFSVARYRADGSTDTSFGSGGVVADAIPGPDLAGYSFARVRDVAVQPDHKIVVVGEYHLDGGATLTAVVRLNEDGTPDSGFGDGGRLLAQDITTAAAVQIASNGDVVIGGFFAAGNLSAMRLDSNGDPVNSFGGDGIAVSDAAPIMLDVRDVLVDGDGVIVVAGRVDPVSWVGQMSLTRFKANGELDLSYGSGGIAWSAFPNWAVPTRAARAQDGSIVVVGVSNNGFATARFTSSGKLDPTFDADGMSTTGFDEFSVASDVVVRPNGKTIAIGSVGAGTPAFALFGTTSDGTRDNSFGIGGRMTTQLPLTNHSEGKHGFIDAEGRLLVVGTTGVGAVGMVRYLVDDANPRLRAGFPSMTRSSRLKSLEGDLVGAAARVQVAVRRNLADGRVRWMKTTVARFTKAKRLPGRGQPIWLSAKLSEGGHWTLRLKRRLSKGNYSVFARALDFDGAQTAGLKKFLRVR